MVEKVTELKQQLHSKDEQFSSVSELKQQLAKLKDELDNKNQQLGAIGDLRGQLEVTEKQLKSQDEELTSKDKELKELGGLQQEEVSKGELLAQELDELKKQNDVSSLCDEVCCLRFDINPNAFSLVILWSLIPYCFYLQQSSYLIIYSLTLYFPLSQIAWTLYAGRPFCAVCSSSGKLFCNAVNSEWEKFP